MEDPQQALQTTTDPSSSASPLERRPSGEEDPAAMTIEFLRARLLSERSVSKAARERAQQLAKKVSELEQRLELEIQLRKKLEADRLEILLKFKAELSEEYGDFFASSLGERDESALDSPNSRKHDNNGEYVSYTPIEDGEGMPDSGLEQFDRSDSSQQLGHEEANDEDDETDHSGREKGVLSWGRRKGSRKEFGYSSDWLGRNFSQRSLTSNDGESSHKKWAGKSVRQIRKRESRSYDLHEGENGQSHLYEESGSRIDQPASLRERHPCEDERDTEVERVLEQQAELIEQYEAEEKAQRAWEAKFKEGKVLSNREKGISPSNLEGKLEPLTSTQTSTHSVEEEVMMKHEATNPVPIEGSLPNESAIRHSRKVHPEDISQGAQEGSTSSESVQRSIPQENHEAMAPFESNTACSNVEQVGQRGKYKKHLSSSFRFAVFPDAEPVAGSSPQMHGFTTCKHEEDYSEESGELNDCRGNSGFSDSQPHDSNDCVTSTASLGNQVGATDCPLMGGSHITRDDAESQENGKDMAKTDVLERERVLSHSTSENDIKDSSQNADSPHNLDVKEIEDRRMKGLEGEQDLQHVQGTPVFEAPSHRESKGPGGSDYLQQQPYADFPPQPSKDLDGADFYNLALYSGIRPGVHGAGLPPVSHDETAFRNPRRSLDSFDRVADVLRALEIAKFQVQTSDEQDFPSIGVRNGYGGRDASYTEPPRLPSICAAPSQSYMMSAPYSRGPAPSMHNMHGWGTVSSGYGVGPSRQVANVPYMPHPLRVPETYNLWPPPLPGVHNNMYHYDTRPAQMK